MLFVVQCRDIGSMELYATMVTYFEVSPPVCAPPCPPLVVGHLQQYPVSGLLLSREFRSFQEGEEDGERAYLPVDPMVRDLTNFGLPDTAGSKKLLHETLVMRVTVPPHSQSWGINVCPQNHRNFEEVLFHFNPRRRFVAMNNREDNVWGQQVRTRVVLYNVI